MGHKHKQTVFLTGATGSMGWATLQELLARRDRFDLVLLVLDSPAHRRRLRDARLGEGEGDGVRVIWGDIRNYEDVLEGVQAADLVLHMAAIISPTADRQPELAAEVNLGSVRHIVRAVREQPHPDSVGVIAVGSVAMTGDRLPPLHWGRVGDPLNASVFDNYAVTKIAAERLLIESGLRRWVSLRQTFICIPDVLSLVDPILFHQPLDTAFEFITAADSGRLMANACEIDVPDNFWGRVYNIGGGERCRITYIDFLDRVFGALGLGPLSKLTERSWFARRNFHCQWFVDSDELEAILGFRREGMDDYVRAVTRSAPWYLKAFQIRGVGRLLPKSLIKQLFMKRLASSADGPLGWLRSDDMERVRAFFGADLPGDRDPDWADPVPRASVDARLLDHGFDDRLADHELDINEARSAAIFRGGHCLSTAMTVGDLHTKLLWRCAFDHEFPASPALVLRAGHWCPDCEPAPWNGAEVAAHNPFFAQVYHDIPSA